MFEQVSEELLEKINLTNQIISDGELTANDFSLDFAQQIKDAGPWGKGFSEPIFDGEFELVDQKSLGKKHLKMIVRHPYGQLLDAIAFNVEEGAWPNHQLKLVSLAYKLDINEFRGRVSLQLMVDAISPV